MGITLPLLGVPLTLTLVAVLPLTLTLVAVLSLTLTLVVVLSLIVVTVLSLTLVVTLALIIVLVLIVFTAKKFYIVCNNLCRLATNALTVIVGTDL